MEGQVLEWLKAIFRPRSPEQGARVVVDRDGVRFTHPDGRVDAVTWSALQLAGVETTDTGPFVEDVYFYLEGPDHGFHIPQAAEGVDELVRRLTALPGFDSDTWAAAMSSTENARFVCWRKGPS
jgi:hypothetical protein